MNNVKGINYSRIKVQLSIALSEIRRKETAALILTVEDGYAIKGLPLKRKAVTTELLSELCSGDTVIFIHHTSQVFDRAICERIRLINNDLGSLGYQLLDYALVLPRDVFYASNVGLL